MQLYKKPDIADIFLSQLAESKREDVALHLF